MDILNHKITRIILGVCSFYFICTCASDANTAGPMVIPFMLLGTAASAYGAIQQGQAAKQEAQNAAAIMEYNAKVAEQEGKAQQMRASFEADKHSAMGEQLLAEQNVGFGRAGVLSGTGTAQVVRTETAKQLELDRLMILREGQEAVRGANARAAGMRLQGSSYRMQAKNAGRAGVLSATGTVLSGIGSAGYTNYKMDNKPLFGII
jgi:hypothetical protein